MRGTAATTTTKLQPTDNNRKDITRNLRSVFGIAASAGKDSKAYRPSALSVWLPCDLSHAAIDFPNLII